MRLITKTFHPSAAAPALFSDSRPHWWSSSEEVVQPWFKLLPDPSDLVPTHAGLSSSLTGTEVRSGAGSLQTIGPPLHLLFQLLLLLLQASWRSEPSSALLTSNLLFFSPRHDQEIRLMHLAQSALRLWMTAWHEATSLSYCKRLISRRQTGRK